MFHGLLQEEFMMQHLMSQGKVVYKMEKKLHDG